MAKRKRARKRFPKGTTHYGVFGDGSVDQFADSDIVKWSTLRGELQADVDFDRENPSHFAEGLQLRYIVHAIPKKK